ncbi:ArsR/SmtB family transcription factor [Metaclostridioides mangenotii]|uniref:ArsR/SmtB family transcription factor n=1 Tax=Metaclostridioides mangenotii TaxID=1540 RepID=UPI00047FFF98|nr:metalloregulator ArsR/SmtB family transcription factor [Clostridioides mangenotii]
MDINQMAKVFKALSNENRLELYLKILESKETSYVDNRVCECFVTDLIKSFKIGAPTISHHIKELVNAQLITTEKRGKFLICKVNEDLLQDVKKMLSL